MGFSEQGFWGMDGRVGALRLGYGRGCYVGKGLKIQCRWCDLGLPVIEAIHYNQPDLAMVYIFQGIPIMAPSGPT